MDSIYHELILDLYRNPLNKDRPEKFDISYRENNPICGDNIEIFLKLNNRKVELISWQGDGCAISQASASMISDYLKGKNIEEIIAFGETEVLELLKLKDLNPSRMRCATLALNAIKKGLA